ncbi:retinol dehydrogenase 11-like [Spea bombifrons]|uniref:retinol dehydrogenase 11-like n=1 Tax=Spea bombifrons TaxID=233779 RepID=UPI00234BB363|nr:retinol dehydrogenase 11-like [Spea bombifrons]
MELPSALGHPGWFFTALLLAVILRLQRKGSWTPRKCRVDLTGKTAIVTGANTGIGKSVAMDLARRNARVILACRSRERGQKAVEEVREATGNQKVSLGILDTSSLSSVRAFAQRTLLEEKRLDILINNAGASGLPHSMTADGLENTFVTNHLGPFLLTNLLLDLMKRSAPSRIVFVSSFIHSKGVINPRHLKGEDLQSLHISDYYSSTKLMNLVCANELARRLQGTGVTVTSQNPGVVVTEAMRNYNIVMRFIFHLLGFFFFKSAEEGAASTIFCAVSEEAEGMTGKYVDSDCTVVLPAENARDPDVAKKLWEACESATGLDGREGQ